MDIKKRNAAIAGFRAPSEEPKVFIISLKAGGVGLNVRMFVNPLCTRTYGAFYLAHHR